MMAEDPPATHGSSVKVADPCQSAVARLLLASSMLDHEDARKEDDQPPHTTPSAAKTAEVGQQAPPSEDVNHHGYDSTDGSPLCDNRSGQHDLSPDVYITFPPSGPGLKALKCPMCDYSTNDKSNFRRHKRLHMRNNPATVLRCGKCDFSTVLPRRIREHYSQDHGEDYGPPQPLIPEATALRIQTFSDNHFSNNHFSNGSMEIPHNQCTQTAIPVAGTIHTLMGAPPNVQFRRSEPQILTNCVTQYRPYEVPMQHVAQENHMASDYLRSIVSNIITTHHTPRVPATSTITSSSFYLPTSVDSRALSPFGHTLSTRQQTEESMEEKLQVKVEPVDCDRTSHVSSSATPAACASHGHVAHHSEVYAVAPSGDHNNEATPSGHHIVNTQVPMPPPIMRPHIGPPDVRAPHSLLSAVDPHEQGQILVSRDMHPIINMREVHPVAESLPHRPVLHPQSLRPDIDIQFVHVPVKTEMSTVGIQCTFPLVKTENPPLQDHCDRRQSRTFLIERSVQCELLSSGRRISSTRMISDSGDENQSGLPQESKCAHCGVTFEDEVLFSIHIGCHSHTDPFICNVCGKQCYNKYGFYSHIMRGHHM